MTRNAVEVVGLTFAFGAFTALYDLTFAAGCGQVRGVIGPNGAGKTTLLDVLTGKSRPRRGRALLDGTTDLAGMTEVQRALAGIGRKFQKSSVFEALTVEENLDPDLALRLHRRPLLREVAARRAAKEPAIARLLDTVGLAARWTALAGTLSHGEKQWLEIGMVLVQDPKVLLLDEPAAGLSDHETRRTAELVLSLRSPQRSIVVVEHDMDFVEQVADRVTVLHEGVQPNIVAAIEAAVASLKGRIAILLVEQYYDFARSLADRYVVLERGAVAAEGAGAEMDRDNISRFLSI